MTYLPPTPCVVCGRPDGFAYLCDPCAAWADTYLHPYPEPYEPECPLFSGLPTASVYVPPWAERLT